MKFDLHVHTNYSDGKFTPSQIIDLAIGKGLNGIAITDHDTVDGIEEAIEYSKRYESFKVIPGIELGCIHNNEEVHILGYFIDYKSDLLLNATEILKSNRVKRGKEIINKLRALNIDIHLNEVQSLSETDFIGRVHIAKILVEKHYVRSISQAFERYLNINAPAYVPRKTFSISESINLINRVGGVAVLAHPGILKEKDKIIDYCIKKGIQGIECIQSKHSDKEIGSFKSLSLEKELLITGGSDCHGEEIDNDLLLGKFYVSEYIIAQMEELI